MANLFESNWSATKEALLEGVSGNRKSSLDVVLENTKRYLSEAATTGATGAGSTHRFGRRRVWHGGRAAGGVEHECCCADAEDCDRQYRGSIFAGQDVSLAGAGARCTTCQLSPRAVSLAAPGVCAVPTSAR